MPLTKTVVVQILPDGAARAVFERDAEDAARWMNKVFRRLYADKRNHKWVNYGAGKDWGQSYGSIVRWQPRNEEWHVVGEALYPAFIRKDAPDRIDSPLCATTLQLLSQKVATAWGNFISAGGQIPRPKGHLSRMGGVAAYMVPSGKFVMGNNDFTIEIDKKVILSVHSDDKKFVARLELIRRSISKKKGSAVEIRKTDNKWYAHICVTVEAPQPVRQPDRVMGIDVGVRNLMTAAIVNTKTEIPQSLRISGMPIVHQLERIKARVRRLRSMKDGGNKNARRPLERLKEKRCRMQQAALRQAGARVVKMAVEQGAEGVAVEDLRKMKKPDFSRRMNRLVSGWARGDGRDFVALKAAEGGLGFFEIYPQGTSSRCPRCNTFDRSARDRATHLFTCKACRFTMNDDDVGAVNIARRGYNYWHSSKWDNESLSTPQACVAGETAEAQAEARESRDPESKQPDGTGRHASDACPGNQEKPTLSASVQATSRGMGRVEPSKVQKPMRQLYKIPRASGKVARGAPGGARTVNKPAGDSPINPATAPRDLHPLENGDPPPIEADPPPSQRLGTR